ncbi:MAG: hypothetical protein WC829_03005 [Hyphomicrobium sp.]|jgi:hypothetical protein
MTTVSTITTFSLPAGQVAIFERGGKGTANVDPTGRANIYTIGEQEAFLGPYDKAVSIVVTPSSPVSYRIDSDKDMSDQSGSLKGVLVLDPTTGAMQIGGAAPTAAQRASVRAGLGVSVDFKQILDSKAATGVARVSIMGTSIAASSSGTLAKLEEDLKIFLGTPCGNSTQLGGLGGSYTTAFSNWVKQPYGGPMFIRSRGNSGSTAFSQTFYGDKLVIRYSKETDGGSFSVLIDDVAVSTIDCNGAQSYNNRAEFSLVPGNHKITFSPPASGYAYLEAYETYDSTKTGVLVRNYTRGGTALKNAVFLATAESPQVAGVTISGNSGLDGQFDDQCDLAIIQWVVNDAGSNDSWVTGGGYAAALAYLVGKYANAGIPVVLVIEMAGHYALSLPANEKTNFDLIYASLIALDGPFVRVVDWHNKTIEKDLKYYAGKYYALSALDVGAGTYTGDFVHPAATKGGYTALDGILSDLLDVQISRNSSNLLEAAKRINYFGDYDAQLASIDVNGASADVVAGASTYWSFCTGPSSLTTGKPIPLYVKADVVNQRPDTNTTIAASGTEDEFGKYIVASTTNISMSSIGLGSTCWVTFLVSGGCNVRATAAAARAIDDYGVVAPLDGSNRWNHFSSVNTAGNRPYYVTIKLAVSAANATLSATTTSGRLYGVWCNTGDAPVIPAVLA